MRRILCCALCFLSWLVFSPSLRGQTPCEAMAAVRLDQAKILSAAPVAAMPVQGGGAVTSNPAHCEVRVLLTPTSDSLIHFVLWLPPASAWNGKYLQLGSGGWGGVTSERGMITPLSRGYAVASTDDGHDGKADGTGRFTLGHPEKLKDFGFRAVHLTSVDARALLDAYYGKPDQHAYFVGCSDGGREALMEAERFPEDFEGIVAGAPANHWTHQFAGFVWNERAVFAAGKSILTPEKLAVVEKGELAACDKLDGLADGLIDDPRRCHFDPEVLACKQGDAPDCLTAGQVDAVRKIHAGLKDSRTGEQVYPGFEPGTEAEDSAWQHWILEHRQADFGNSNFADATYESSSWNWRTSDLHDDVRLAEAKVGPWVDSYNPDLRSFRDRGGKLLQYHGWGDAAVAPEDSILFYGEVTRFLATYPDPRYQETPDIHGFYRLFMVPGMSHCWGGAGTGSFGNEVFPQRGVPQDAAHDIVMALDRWVISGVAPDAMVATRTADQPPSLATPHPMSRPLCPYPETARYKGDGSLTEASSFACQAPAR